MRGHVAAAICGNELGYIIECVKLELGRSLAGCPSVEFDVRTPSAAVADSDQSGLLTNGSSACTPLSHRALTPSGLYLSDKVLVDNSPRLLAINHHHNVLPSVVPSEQDCLPCCSQVLGVETDAEGGPQDPRPALGSRQSERRRRPLYI